MDAASPITVCHFSDSSSPHHIHSHLSGELIYVRRGKVVITVNKTEYLAESGTAVLISGLEEHSVRILEPPYERYFLMVSTEELDRQLLNPKLASVFKNRPRGFCHLFDFKGDKSRMDTLFEEIYRECSQPDSLSGELITALMKQLLIRFYRCCPQNFTAPDSPSCLKILQAQQYLEAHFTEPVSISNLAKSLFLSTGYLSHTFKEITGYSPKQYLLLNRLTYSKELLLQTDLSIQQVAVQSGFTDVNNFIRYFKAQYGVTPHRYRKQ